MYILCYGFQFHDPYLMTLQSLRPFHALNLPELRHRIACHPLPRRSDLFTRMLVSRDWMALLNKHGRFEKVVETKSEANFRTLQHGEVRNLERLTVSLPESGAMQELGVRFG
ncbi:hypothetical protein BGZ47_001054 [Haplosporangium gracile]|nr:hypothetical protein BGZ47_001054 [Haplosporangium gracile]